MSDAEASPDAPAPLRATYRVQFRSGFRLRDAEERVAYLDALGVSHLYASPLLRALPGSSHGYDVTDPGALDPELGEEAELASLAAALRSREMGLVLDIVPNHVGVAGADNQRWLDVLEYGRASPFADWFDIDWKPTRRELRGKVLLPVLGAPYGDVLEAGELVPRFDAESGGLSVWYHEHRFPICPRDLGRLLSDGIDTTPELAPALETLTALPPSGARLPAAALAAKTDLAARLESSARALRSVEGCVAGLAGRPGEPRSFERLHDLLERQHYRLAWWRSADDQINYRRFFDVSELAALRVERPAVFDATHARVLRWVGQGWVEGLRIDHVDGLLDPRGYCAQLRRACGGRAVRIWLEKILASDEALCPDWPVEGTTGYEFLNAVNGLFVDARAERDLELLDRSFCGRRSDFDTLVYDARKHVMSSLLASELRGLSEALERRAAADWRSRDFGAGQLQRALGEIVACFPVYRTYVDDEGATAEDRRILDRALAEAQRRAATFDPVLFEWIRKVLLAEEDGGGRQGVSRPERLRLAGRVQQFTGPVAAKGLEDTAFYRHQRLVSLNEVGGDPRRFGVEVADFHAANTERAERWPRALLATATHDTKRGEDTRARIDVLSERPREWGRGVARWRRLNADHKSRIDGAPAPDGAHEYLLYQTLVGSWPGDVAPGTLPPQEILADYRARVAQWLRKAIREGKERSSWRYPRLDYEDASERFLERLLDPALSRHFLDDFLSFQAETAAIGAVNGLAQLALKLTSPGVPDVYQGCELWDLSLADPDNRRAIDWAARARALDTMRDAFAGDRTAPLLAGLVERWWDGRVKLLVTWRLLELRRRWPRLFSEGRYRPLEVRGERAAQVCAFARVLGDEAVVVAAPRLCGGLPRGEAPFPLGETSWGDTALLVPELEGRRSVAHALTDRPITCESTGGRPALRLAELFAELPVAATQPGPAAP